MKKIQRTQTRDHITQMLRYEILSGNIKAGEELAQESIAELIFNQRKEIVADEICQNVSFIK